MSVSALIFSGQAITKRSTGLAYPFLAISRGAYIIYPQNVQFLHTVSTNLL